MTASVGRLTSKVVAVERGGMAEIGLRLGVLCGGLVRFGESGELE